jgi:hypothetical protein
VAATCSIIERNRGFVLQLILAEASPLARRAHALGQAA